MSKNNIKVQLNHRTDDRFTATIKLIGYTEKELHLMGYWLQEGYLPEPFDEVGMKLDRKLADFYLNRNDPPRIR